MMMMTAECRKVKHSMAVVYVCVCACNEI